MGGDEVVDEPCDHRVVEGFEPFRRGDGHRITTVLEHFSQDSLRLGCRQLALTLEAQQGCERPRIEPGPFINADCGHFVSGAVYSPASVSAHTNHSQYERIEVLLHHRGNGVGVGTEAFAGRPRGPAGGGGERQAAVAGHRREGVGHRRNPLR